MRYRVCVYMSISRDTDTEMRYSHIMPPTGYGRACFFYTQKKIYRYTHTYCRQLAAGEPVANSDTSEPYQIILYVATTY
jgi:hypothetical protein